MLHLVKQNLSLSVEVPVHSIWIIAVKLTTEEMAPRVIESPTPAIRTDGAHSPTQIVPRSHVTLECMPSPQFSDSVSAIFFQKTCS